MASESMDTKEEFHYISGKESPLHPLHKAEFRVDGEKYNFVEQYVLYKKAELCKATKQIAELMRISDPNHLKKFETAFVVADTKTWETKQKEFMKKAYLEKSRQVKALLNLLQDTKGKILVYATRKDCLLGIGVDAADPLSHRKSNWRGKNLLGEWLMEVREEIQNRVEGLLDDGTSKQKITGGSPQHTQVAKAKESCGPEKFTFFWQKESPFSQWHPCSFVIDDQWYNCAEQYMMHQKAVKFGDSSAAWEILSTKDPKRQKHVGRKVMNFDEKEWNLVCKDVVKRGNLAKFGQNENLKQLLFETAGTTLVEASPVDNIWGIGLDAKDPKAQNRQTWKGENRLGQILTEVREELMSQGNEKVHSQHVERSLGAREKADTGKPIKRKADDINQGQERKSTEGVTDVKLSKGPDPTASRKVRDQQKSNFQGGKSKRGQTQRQNSPQKKDRITKDENCDVEMMREVENWDDKMALAESKTALSRDCQNISVIDKTEDIMETNSVSQSQNEAPVSLEKMEFSSVNLQEGNEEAEEAVDPAWEGFNAMELDIEEDVKEKKRRERSKDISHQNSDKLRQLQKGKTGYSSRQEQEQPEDTTMFDDQGPREKFTFFWRADSPFSQHHPANFNIDGVGYNCAEQYMMHQKAVVFGDDRVGYEIMQTINPAKQKSLAKQVEGFNEVYWKTLRRDVVKRGNIEKFSQNPRLRRMLFATAGTTMVEASPMDNTWGIGLSADDPKAWHRRTWAGGNMLGEILTEVRDELMEKFKNMQEEEADEMSYRRSDGSDEQYTVFWRPVSPFHPRYPVGFVLDNQYYWTLQQYLLHQKASFFEDTLTARAIMETLRPNKLEELGRKVRKYDNRLWSRYLRSYLTQGNFAKFSQNPHIRQQLIDNVLSGELVFAVEEDCLLGVGLKEEDGRLYRKKSWKGKNLLGQALMKVREMLMKNEQMLPEVTEELDDEAAVEEIPERQFQFFFIKSPFNQWHLCRFRIGNLLYNSAEQYMLHQMALHFHDQQAAECVMRCRHPRDMQTVEIRNYDEHNWEKVCKEIIMEGNRAKFTQDNKLREELLKTDDTILAYASVNDVLLGIGLRDNDQRAFDQQNWPGYNILGQVLMEVREELKQQRNNKSNNNNSGLVSRKTWQSESRESVEYPTSGQPAENFTFFWTKSPFSQWWRCEINIDGTAYNCTEQYMMHQKALYFNDLKTAKEIMKSGRPLDQWKLGRKVRGYDSDKWNAVCQDIVKTGNMAKFSQHRRMRQQLFDTAGTTLVEASPIDNKWGIGVTENDPRARRKETWLGQNLLGQILTEVRDELMKQENDNVQNYNVSNFPVSGLGHERRGSEHSDSSQGRRKDSESGSRGFSRNESYQNSRPDQGVPTGRSHQSHGGGNQRSYQKSRSDHDGAAGRPNQHFDGGYRSHQNSRPFCPEQPHVDESRQYHDGNRQKPLMNSSRDQHRNTEKHQVQELKSTSSGHSEQPVSQKSRSTRSGQSDRTVTQDLHSVPAQHSERPATQSGATQSLQSCDSNTDSRVVVDETISKGNIHIISETATLSLWHQRNFKVDGFEYNSVGQYLAHQKALRFNDGNSAEEIMKSSSPRRVIQCDKYIEGFDEKKWNSIYRDVIKDGNYNKLSQNEDLKQELLATSGSLLAYADGKDLKLGVGLKSNDRGIHDRNRWKGENILGFVLMEIREDLIHGRDSSKTGRVSDAVTSHNDLKQINEEDKRKEVQERTLDRDVKEVTSEGSVSLGTENFETTNSLCLYDKGEPEKDAEAVTLEYSAEFKKDGASKVQRQEILQETSVPRDIPEQTAPKPLVSTDNQSKSKHVSKVVESSDDLEVLQKVETAETNSEQTAFFMTEKETEMKYSVVTNEAVVETVDTPQSSPLTDNSENNKKTASDASKPSGKCEIFSKVSHSETAQTVATQSDSYFERDCAAEKDLEESKIDAKDSDLAEIQALELDSKSQATRNDKESNIVATLETQATSQTQADDDKKNEDGNENTMTSEPQAPLDTTEVLGGQKGEKAATSDAGKQGLTGECCKNSANGESHQEETISTAPEIKGLEVQSTTPSTCQVISVTEEMDTKSDTKETSHSGKEDLADKIGIESHQEETVQQASTVTEGPYDKNSIESHPEEPVSEAPEDKSSNECEQQENPITLQETKLVKEELDDKSHVEGDQEQALSTAAVKDASKIRKPEILQETTVPGDISEENTATPLASTDNQSDSKDVSKIDDLEVQQKIEVAKKNSEQEAFMREKEIENKFSRVASEAVETVDTTQSFPLTDNNENNKKTTASDASAPSGNHDIFSRVPHSETAQSDRYFERDCAAEKDLEERKVGAIDSDLAEVQALELDSKCQAAGNDKEVSNVSDTFETQATSQTQADDKKNEDGNENTMMSEPQAPLDTKNILGGQKGEEADMPDAGKQGVASDFSKDSGNGESHQEETVSTAPEIKGLGEQSATASACQMILVKEEMDTKSDTKETSHSGKEDSADKIGTESQQDEAISTASKAVALQVQSINEETVQHKASTTVKEGPDDKNSTESHPETVSAGITENISHDVTSVKEKLENKGSAEGNQEAGSTAPASAFQETSAKPSDKSSAEAGKEEDVSSGDKEVLGAEYSNESTTQEISVEEELDKIGFESDQEHVSTTAETEMLQAQTISENTTTYSDTSARVELTDKSGVELTAQSITEKADDKSSNECEEEENHGTLQEMKAVKEGLGDKSHVECDQEQKVARPAVTKILEVQAGNENSCQETKLVKDALADEIGKKLEDKSSVKNIPEDVSSQAAVKEIFQAQSSCENTNQETTSVKEGLGSEVKDALEDKSSTESHQGVAEKGVLPPPADTEITYPVMSTKEEIDKKNSTEGEVSQQVTDVGQQATNMCGTKEDTPELTDLQIVDKRNEQNEEHAD